MRTELDQMVTIDAERLLRQVASHHTDNLRHMQARRRAQARATHSTMLRRDHRGAPTPAETDVEALLSVFRTNANDLNQPEPSATDVEALSQPRQLARPAQHVVAVPDFEEDGERGTRSSVRHPV